MQTMEEHCLLACSPSLTSLFSYKFQNHLPRDRPSCVWAFPHQSSIMKTLSRILYKPILWRCFLEEEGSFFPHDCALYQANTNLAAETLRTTFNSIGLKTIDKIYSDV